MMRGVDWLEWNDRSLSRDFIIIDDMRKKKGTEKEGSREENERDRFSCRSFDNFTLTLS